MEESSDLSPDIIVGPDGKYPTIAAAIEVAQSGQRIRVRPGVYREPIRLDRGIRLVGEGPRDLCVIETAESPCVAIRGEGAELQGLTIRFMAPQEYDDLGHAVHVMRSSLRLIDCDVTAGPAHRKGRHCVFIAGEGASLIEHCRIHGSSDGVTVRFRARVVIKECEICKSISGVEIEKNGYARIERSKIRDNRAWGLRVDESASLEVANCEIFNNKDHAISAWHSEVSILNSSIHGNRDFGLMLVFGRGKLEGCTISNNRLNIWSDSSDLTVRACNINDAGFTGCMIMGGRAILEDCEILRNNALKDDLYKGGVEIWNETWEPADVVLRRCRVNDNTTAAVWVNGGREVVVEDCDLRGNAKGSWVSPPGSNVRASGNLE